jgi:hypothetical protein
MKRITTVLKESEAMAVRKAVCVAGGEHVVIIPMPERPCASATQQRYGVPSAPEREVHVRLEVTADDGHSRGIISAIQRIAHFGSISVASSHDRPHKCAA